MKRGPDDSDVLGAIRWRGVDGIIIPSDEGYGVIFTADPNRMVITVPYSTINQIRTDMPKEKAEALLEPMFVHISEMLAEMSEESRGPE